MTEDTKPSSTDEHDPNERTPADGSSQQESAGADAQPSSANPGSEAPGSVESPDPLAQAQAEAARLKDQLLRTAADFDNFRKRSRREIEDAYLRGREELLRDLLPVFDNLERALVHADQATDVKAVAEGVRMVLKFFYDTLSKTGIQRIDAVGKPFDPTVHDAFQQLETSEHPPGTVVSELQAGYAMGERLIRAAMVVVAKPPTKTEQANGDAGSDH